MYVPPASVGGNALIDVDGANEVYGDRPVTRLGRDGSSSQPGGCMGGYESDGSSIELYAGDYNLDEDVDFDSDFLESSSISSWHKPAASKSDGKNVQWGLDDDSVGMPAGRSIANGSIGSTDSKSSKYTRSSDVKVALDFSLPDEDGWKEQGRGSLLAASVHKHRALPPDSKHFVPYPTLDAPCRSSDINSEGGPLSPTLVGSIINSTSVKVRATSSATASSKLQKLQVQRSSPSPQKSRVVFINNKATVLKDDIRQRGESVTPLAILSGNRSAASNFSSPSYTTMAPSVPLSSPGSSSTSCVATSKHILMSYARGCKNENCVRTLATNLKFFGFNVYCDGGTNEPGYMEPRKCAALDNALVTIICTSKEYYSICRDEAEYAMALERMGSTLLVFVMLDDNFTTESCPEKIGGWLNRMMLLYGGLSWFPAWASYHTAKASNEIKALITRTVSPKMLKTIYLRPTKAIEQLVKKSEMPPSLLPPYLIKI